MTLKVGSGSGSEINSFGSATLHFRMKMIMSGIKFIRFNKLYRSMMTVNKPGMQKDLLRIENKKVTAGSFKWPEWAL